MNPTDPNNSPERPLFGASATQSSAGPSAVSSNDIYPAPTNPLPPPAASPPPKKPINHDNWRSIISTALLLILAPLIALSIAAFVIQSYQVDGESMETTLQNHDRLIVNKLPRSWARLTRHAYVPHRGDIIIFNQAGLPDTGLGQEKQLIKRVVGLPGERVVVKNGHITIYNSSHSNGFNPDTQAGYSITAKLTPGDVDISLASEQIFVSGDNRTNSEDSRYFGPVSVNNIVGKLVLRLLPLNKVTSF